MDEKTMQSINEAAERFRQAFIDAFQPAIEQAVEVLDEIVKIAKDVISAINQQKKERSKWRIVKLQPIKQLFQDKRCKICRCRNEI